MLVFTVVHWLRCDCTCALPATFADEYFLTLTYPNPALQSNRDRTKVDYALRGLPQLSLPLQRRLKVLAFAVLQQWRREAIQQLAMTVPTKEMEGGVVAKVSARQ